MTAARKRVMGSGVDVLRVGYSRRVTSGSDGSKMLGSGSETVTL